LPKLWKRLIGLKSFTSTAPSTFGCKFHDETLDHLSLDCPFANVVWDGINTGLRAMFPTSAAPLSVWWPAAVDG
jgi:hypothetical protein